MIVEDFGDQSSDASVKEKGQVHKVSFANEAPLEIYAEIMICKELLILCMPGTWCKVNSEMIE